MKNEGYIEGQISIFDLPVTEVVQTKKIIIKEENKEIDKFDSIIKLYSHSCSRIVKTFSGALLVELDDKTIYFNFKGINEFNLPFNEKKDKVCSKRRKSMSVKRLEAITVYLKTSPQIKAIDNCAGCNYNDYNRRLRI